MRRERTTRFGVCVLLLAAVALTGCRIAEHGRRAAIDAFASFVLDSVFRMQQAAPLTQALPVRGGQALMPVPPRAVDAAPVPPPVPDRQECLSSTKLPTPKPLIASIDLVPRVDFCRVRIDVARARVEARMAVAELRGVQDVRVRRIVVIAPEEPSAL